MSQRKMRLGAFIMATGHHIAAWRHPGSQPDSGVNIDHYIHVAQTAERGKFDQVFVADSPGVAYRGGDNEAFSRQGRVSYFEPVTLWAALSVVTKHIGFVATASTTYEDPFLLARKFASLDHISKGRAAWNVVTTGAENVYGNFGLEAHPDPELRYEKAHEFLDVVKGLWDSFEDDAFSRDPESGVYFDPEKLHALNHHGKHLKVSGPLNLERSPQGQPVIVQAGSSEPGRELAAATAEAIFTAWTSLEEAQAFYSDVKGRLAKYGRRADQLLILPGISPVIGRTQEEAEAKWAELQKLIHPSVGLDTIARFWPGEDLTKWDLDAPPPYYPTPPAGKNSRHHVVIELARRERFTVRQLYEYLAGARGHWVVVGTPQKIADEMQKWFENGAADGFNVMPPVLPESLEEFVDLVIPELQKRGLFRTEYEGTTLRENLGLDKPQNRFSIKAAKAA
ncbi:NtaA/DmoA family FMN-dependent monooxygenase [Massilia dura]|uniref:NtaA/DmoA family FMN-dependent monooxygenase n=1 Tax=Pseudoduganella dura TaxID=321982 RepID=A0A6I3XG36_9BURK|nr:LLM class flavin-dependent oxidoreductase [Pseudoduganella dura]MUI13480.1 NtaA/DmoA family FMN-dependent monooxygenase [Pseudoduganella dura]GGX83072.1 monooxygenase [Pseudoduganella dura]